MPNENKERLGVAQHLRQQATRYREFAASLEGERAAKLMERLAAEFDERAFDIIYEHELMRRERAA